MAPPRNVRGYIINAMKKRKTGEKDQPPEKKSREEPVSDIPSTADIDPAQIPVPPPDEMDTRSINDVDMSAIDDAAAGGGNSSAAGSSRATRSVGGSMSASSNGGGLRGTAILPRGIRQEGMRSIRKFRKQYLLRLQNEVVEIGHKYEPVFTASNSSTITATNGSNYGSFGTIRYPYHDLPVHYLGFYLTKEEINSLRYYSEARVINCQVDVYNKTGVLNFETGSSLSSIGNNNVGIYLVELSKDIGRKRTGTIPDQAILIDEVFWGERQATIAKENREFTSAEVARLGARYVRRTLNNKFEYWTPMNQSMDPAYTEDTYMQNDNFNYNVPGIVPYFNVNNFIEKRINASMNEGHFTSWSYKPKDGLVAGYFDVGPLSLFNSRMKINQKLKMPLQSASFTTDLSSFSMKPPLGIYNTGGQDVNMETQNPRIMVQRPFRTINGSRTKIERTLDSGNVVPPLVIGIEPLVSELPTSTGNTWSPVRCFVDLYVDVELEMEVKYGYDYVDPAMPSIPANYKFPQMSLYEGDTNFPFVHDTDRVDLIDGNNPAYPSNISFKYNIPVFPDKINPLMESERVKKVEDTPEYVKPVTRSQTAAAGNNSELVSILKKLHPNNKELKNL